MEVKFIDQILYYHFRKHLPPFFTGLQVVYLTNDSVDTVKLGFDGPRFAAGSFISAFHDEIGSATI